MSIQSKVLTLAFSSSLLLGGAAVTAQQAETMTAPLSTTAQQTGAALEQGAFNNAQQLAVDQRAADRRPPSNRARSTTRLR